jgi:hypothetical protein
MNPKALLDELKSLDHTVSRAYYEMGRLLAAITDHGLYDQLGYNSIHELVEEELSFSPGTAYKYMSAYRQFRRLKYSKSEAYNIINTFGYTNVIKVLPGLKNKAGPLAIRRRLEANPRHQLNIMLSDDQYRQTMAVYDALGAIHSPAGKVMNSSEIFLEIIERVGKLLNVKEAA